MACVEEGRVYQVGTFNGNPLSMAAARATMSEVLTDAAYARSQANGARLADGLEHVVASAGLPWTVHRFWPRSGFSFTPAMPVNGADAVRDLDVDLRRLMRTYLANRGVWEAIVGAGPTCSVASTASCSTAAATLFMTARRSRMKRAHRM